MKVNLQKEAREFLNAHEHYIVTIKVDHECVGANCSTNFSYPVVTYKMPDFERIDDYERFDMDELTIYFDKKLETVPEITLKLEHHILKNTIKVEGLPEPPPITHSKL
jgi:hypothetical protein